MDEIKDIALGQKVRRIREMRGYSQSYVADKLSIAQSKYSELETGKKDISDAFLEEVAAILEVHSDIIRNYSDHVIFNNCSQSGYYNVNNINDLSTVHELYKSMMEIQEARIVELKIALEAKDKLITVLEKNQK